MERVVYEAHEILVDYISCVEPQRKAAILLSVLPAEVIMEISRDFSEREIRSLIPLMTSLSHEWTLETVAIIDEFFHINDLWNTVIRMASTPEEIVRSFENWARQNPRKLGRFIKSTWLQKKR